MPRLPEVRELALDCVHSEYPNKIAHSLSSDADVKPPRELTPAFMAVSIGTPAYTDTGCWCGWRGSSREPGLRPRLEWLWGKA